MRRPRLILRLVRGLGVTRLFVRDGFRRNYLGREVVVRVEVLRELSISLFLLLICKLRLAYCQETVHQNAYSLILASNPTRFSSSSVFRGLGILMTFLGAVSSRVNQSENSDLFAKSLRSPSLIVRAAIISLTL
jgi:hypothetical protein